MASLMAVLFIGSVGLTQYYAVVAGPQETILSALATRLLGRGPAYLLIQVSTMLILAVAANTSFTGFPRVTAILAGDGLLRASSAVWATGSYSAMASWCWRPRQPL